MKVEKGQEEFERLSKVIRKEVARFENYRVEDFKNSVIKYLQTLMENQQKVSFRFFLHLCILMNRFSWLDLCQYAFFLFLVR